MFSGKNIRLERELWAKVERAARSAGYSSPVEFIRHVLERESDRLLEEESEDDRTVRRRLEGLGYLG